MAAIITEKIPPRSFEVVRDRIAQILAMELINQNTLSPGEGLNVNRVHVSRLIPFEDQEMPAINVMPTKGEYTDFTRTRQDGTYEFSIICYQKSATVGSGRGDELAGVKLDRLMGVCQYILSHWKYDTLGFAPPFIERTEVQSISYMDAMKANEASSAVVGVLSFTVRVPEDINKLTPQNIESFTTSVKLEETDKGYIYTA